MSPFTYLTRQQLNAIPDLEPMIDGVLDKGTVVVLAAQPRAGKSFLAIDWACSYAAGRDWQGRAIDTRLTYPDDKPGPGKALYIAAEGARGLKRRVSAWEQSWRTEVPDESLVVVPHPIQLGSLNEVSMLCADLEKDTAGLVVIDTVARCTVGLEENSATDMGKVIEAAYRIRNAMGPDGTVLLIHHQGKSGDVRGSSALLGGVDQLMTLKRDGDDLELADEKRKDGLELEATPLRLAQRYDSLIIESGAPDSQRSNPLVEQMRTLTDLLPLSKNELRMATQLSDFALYQHLSAGIKAGLIRATNEKNPRYSLTEYEGVKP